MSVVTEIAHIPLQASLAIEVTDGAVGKTFSRMLDLLRNAQGSLGVYWSRQVEHVDILEILIGMFNDCRGRVWLKYRRLGGLRCLRGVPENVSLPRILGASSSNRCWTTDHSKCQIP